MIDAGTADGAVDGADAEPIAAERTASAAAIPGNDRALARLQRHVLREVTEANVLGALLIVIFYTVFQQSLAQGDEKLLRLIFGLLVCGFVAVLLVSWQTTRPLARYLGDGGHEPPSQRLQIAVVVQPVVQSLMVFMLWFVGAVALGLVTTLTLPSDSIAMDVRRFVTTFGGILVGGIATTAIVYLRIEHTWRRWLPRFFPEAGTDPTTLPLPRSGLAGRLRASFVLGAMLPMLVIALASSFTKASLVPSGRLEQVTWFLVIASIVMGAILARNVRVSITEPVDRLGRAMEQVEQGDLDVHVPVDRNDELGRLQRGFNDMVESVRARDRVEQLLERQVGGQVAQKAIGDAATDDGATLGGEIRHASALFVDLTGYTTITEAVPPHAIAQLLNATFDVVVRAVEESGGLVNKFQGDAVFAVFGAPADDPDHAAHALEAATLIAGELEARRIDFGVGVSTGEVFAGNVGTESRYEYTVVGDPVNEAARLQEMTRSAQRRILLSGRTADVVRNAGGPLKAALVPLGTETLRGKVEPTDIFSLSAHLWRNDQGFTADVEVMTDDTDVEDDVEDAAEVADVAVAVEAEPA
jgi:adenylate cyclase